MGKADWANWTDEQWAEWGRQRHISGEVLDEARRRRVTDHLNQLAKGKAIRDNNAALSSGFRSVPCVDCDKFYYGIMELDHVRGRKLFSLASCGRRSIEQILAEMEKCDVRCPICHRMRHFWERHPEDPYFVENPPHPAWVAIRDSKQLPRQAEYPLDTTGEKL